MRALVESSILSLSLSLPLPIYVHLYTCQFGTFGHCFGKPSFATIGLKPIKLTWNRNPTRSSRHFCSRKNPWLFCVSWAFACCCAAARQCLKKTWGQLGLHDVGLLQEFPSSWSWMCWHDFPYSVSISLWRVPCVPCVPCLPWGGLSWRKSGQTCDQLAESGGGWMVEYTFAHCLVLCHTNYIIPLCIDATPRHA